MMTHRELRDKYSSFLEKREHASVQPAPLVLSDDATTLFTSAGMQPLVPYLMGEEHPEGKRLYNIQPCIRTQDIDEVGDNRHTTFFEMMGNWSLGEYFKKEQLAWLWEFYTVELGLPKDRLHVTIFEGNDEVEKDEEARGIWKELGVDENHNMHEYDDTKNWWSRSGPPSNMPVGEIGGPSSEVFYEFRQVKHDSAFGKECHPNCDCGRYMEIGNSVFIQYKKEEDGSLSLLPQKNVDYGGGLERILAACNDSSDIFAIDLFQPIIEEIESCTSKKYEDHSEEMRIIADHLRAATFLIVQGVKPSNKEHGYILRRLLRRSMVKMYQIDRGAIAANLSTILDKVLEVYDGVQGMSRGNQREKVLQVLDKEQKKFAKSLDKGLRVVEKTELLNAKVAFNLYQSYGFPFEITQELAAQKGIQLDEKAFEKELKEHQDKSRSASAGKFKGGLADHSDQVVKYHTATHLLHQALKDVFGNSARQEGSNITQERLRFDVRLSRKPTDDEKVQLEKIVNEKISENLPVFSKVMSREDAEKLGAASFFKEKYGDSVKVYFVGGSEDDLISAYSKEFCGGPHVKNTGEIGSIRIKKIKKIGGNMVRIYAD